MAENKCRAAASDFALALSELKRMERAAHEERVDPNQLKSNVEGVEAHIARFRRALGISPFPNEHHDLSNLSNQAGQEHPSAYFIQRYSEDLTTTLLADGLLALIDCECEKK